MKDMELRGIVLEQFYNSRNKERYFPKDDQIPGIEMSTIYRICEQLYECGLLRTWKPVGSPVANGFGLISASGVDVMEGNNEPPIPVAITNNNQRISINSISHSQGLFIGNSGKTSIEGNVQEIIQAIKSNTDASEEEKEEALKLLKRFISHPLVTTISGAAIGLLG